MTPIERRAIDYGELDQGMAHLEQVIRDTRRTLDALARGEVVVVSVSRTGADEPVAGGREDHPEPGGGNEREV